MGKVSRQGNDENRINELIAIGRGRQFFAKNYIAFPDSSFYSDLISKSIMTKVLLGEGGSLLMIRHDRLMALANLAPKTTQLKKHEIFMPELPEEQEPAKKLSLMDIKTFSEDLINIWDEGFLDIRGISVSDFIAITDEGSPAYIGYAPIQLVDEGKITFNFYGSSDITVDSDGLGILGLVGRDSIEALGEGDAVLHTIFISSTDEIEALTDFQVLRNPIFLSSRDRIKASGTAPVPLRNPLFFSSQSLIRVVSTGSALKIVPPAPITRSGSSSINVIGTGSIVASSPINLIVNGTFDDDFNGWTIDFGSPLVFPIGGQGGGPFALFTSNQKISQVVAVLPNTFYSLSLWLKHSVDPPNELTHYVIQVGGIEQIYIGTQADWRWALSHTWEYFEWTFMTNSATVAVSIELTAFYADCSLELDSVVLRPI